MAAPLMTIATVYSFTRSIFNILFPLKRKNIVYVPASSSGLTPGDEVLPVAYGYNAIDCKTIYREDTAAGSAGDDFQMAAAICDGEIEEVVKIEVDGIEEDKLLKPSDWSGSTLNNAEQTAAPNRYTGTTTQAADTIFAAGVVDIKPTRDAYVDSGNPTTNYGSSEVLRIDSGIGSYDEIAYLEFDTGSLPLGLTIASAELCISQRYYNGSNYRGKLVKTDNTNWVESTITYNHISRPALVATDYSDYKYLTIKQTQKITLNAAAKADLITAYGTGAKFQFALVKDATTAASYMTFDSREGPTSPYLKIRYTGADACAFRETAYYAAYCHPTYGKITSVTPSIRAFIKGKKIRYWDGDSWETGYTRNPAWQILDILTNDKYTTPIADTDIDLDSFIATAAICDASVTRPDGETEARYMCDIVFENMTDKRSAIMDIMGTFGGFYYDQDGQIAIGCEVAESAPYDHSFTTANMIDGTFSMSEMDKETIPNQVKVLFSDADNNFELDHAIAENNLDIDSRGVKTLELNLIGIKRRSQALRMANWYLWKAWLCNQQATFESSWKDVEVQVGDLADVTYTSAGWSAQPVRIMQIELAESGNARLTVEKYDASIQNDAGTPDDYNTRPQLPKIGLPPDVTSLTLAESSNIQEDGTYLSYIDVTWTWPTTFYDGGLYATVWCKPDGGTYIQRGLVNTGQAAMWRVSTLDGAGTYWIKVQTVGKKTGLVSDWDTAPEDNIAIAGAGNWTVPKYCGFTLTTDSKAEWTTGTIIYKGTKYSISSGDTTNKYIYFDPDISITVLQTAAAQPTLGANGFWFAFYDSGDDTVEQAQCFKMLNVELLKAGSIETSHLNFTAVGSGNIVATINASSEGITIEADNLTIGATTTFAAGYNPTDSVGTHKTSSGTGQRIVVDGSDGTIKWYNSSNTLVLTIDDTIYGSMPGISIGSPSGAAIALSDTNTGSATILSADQLNIIRLTDDSCVWAQNTTNGVNTTPVIYASYGSGDSGPLYAGYAYLTKVFQVESSGNAYFKGNITIDGTVDGVDISAHAANTTNFHGHDTNAHTMTIDGIDVSALATTVGGKADKSAITGAYHYLNESSVEMIMNVTNGVITGISEA